MISATALAFLGPYIVELIKKFGDGILNKMGLDGFKPTTIDDYIKLKEFDLKLFEAINNAGGGNPSYPWVEAFIRLQRPVIAFVVIVTWSISHLYAYTTKPELDLTTINNFAEVIGFYLFADRTLFYIKSKKGG